MVRLPEGYCIDSTEVTRGHYQKWLDTGPSTTGQIESCAWNETFDPNHNSTTCMDSSYVYQGMGSENHPVVCVDWCDAYAYCRAVGRRLCGKIGGSDSAFEDYADAMRSQWYGACVSGTANNAYPYGSDYQALYCNGYGSPPGGSTTVPAGSLAQCQSSALGYQGVLDLSGNVGEWEDSCAGVDPSAFYRIRGGSFLTSTGDLSCRRGGYDNRYGVYANAGFRCCAP